MELVCEMILGLSGFWGLVCNRLFKLKDFKECWVCVEVNCFFFVILMRFLIGLFCFLFNVVRRLGLFRGLVRLVVIIWLDLGFGFSDLVISFFFEFGFVRGIGSL